MNYTGASDTRFPLSEAIFLALVVLVVWFGGDNSEAGPGIPWSDARLMGVPVHYVLLAGLILMLLPYVAVTPHFPLVGRLKESGLWGWLVLSWAVISLVLGIAIVRGAPDLFADWRNLAVTAVVSVLASKWLAAQPWRRLAMLDLAIAFGLLSAPILISYLAGSGSTALGVRTTVFDAPTLYAVSFAAITGVWQLLNRGSLGFLRVVLLVIATVSSILVVLLSLRRSFWVLLGVGMITLLVVFLRSREMRAIRLYAAFLTATLVLTAAYVALGAETVVARIESFNPGSAGGFSSTNQDHVNDLIDAWNVIEDSPILGYGIGFEYETDLIAEWKDSSFEVHNAILHAWLKFGLLGALGYLGFHLAWVRFALRRSSSELVSVGAFVIGFMVATMAGTWPYGHLQIAVLIGLLLAFTFVASPHEDGAAGPEPLKLANVTGQG
jgi:O-antigen ligase